MAGSEAPHVRTIRGDQNDDLLLGSPESDRIIGNAGNDELVGAAGDDWLDGGGGDDVLVGGWGEDRLRGGAGADEFVVPLQDTGHGVDFIEDFSVAEGDRLVLQVRPGVNARRLLDRLVIRKGVLEMRLREGGVVQVVRFGAFGGTVKVLAQRRALIIRTRF